MGSKLSKRKRELKKLLYADAKTDLIVKKPAKIITEPPKKKQVKYACVSIKINLGHSPPFKRVPSLICTAMILSYVGTRRVVYILL